MTEVSSTFHLVDHRLWDKATNKFVFIGNRWINIWANGSVQDLEVASSDDSTVYVTPSNDASALNPLFT